MKLVLFCGGVLIFAALFAAVVDAEVNKYSNSLKKQYAPEKSTKKDPCYDEGKEVRLVQLRLDMALARYSSCIEQTVNPNGGG